MILNAFLLFTLFGNEQKLNCLFIYFSYHDILRLKKKLQHHPTISSAENFFPRLIHGPLITTH